MAAIDLLKLKKDLARAFKGAASTAMASIDRKDKFEVGYAIIDEMRNLISKGVSPIAENGRFPAYKWAGRANAVMKVARGLTGDRKKRARQKAQDMKKGKYPYSVQYKYPSKRERPVNLFLSGDFLKDLEVRTRTNGVEVGFYKKKATEIEEGHRIGWNSQPKRPIIPQNDEQFNPSIYRRMLAVITSLVTKKFRT